MSEIRGIVERITEVKKAAGAVKKTQKTNAGNIFNFRGVDNVVNAIAQALIEQEVLVVPRILSKTSEYITYGNNNSKGFRTEVEVEYTYHSPGGFMIGGSAPGEAIDQGDKSTAKAMSVAYRTFLLQSLTLPTDEPDPDHDQYQVTGQQKKGTQPTVASASDEILGQITDGVAILQPDEKAAFRAWWKERKFPKLEDLLQPEAQILYARLLGILNATADEPTENATEGHTEPSEVIAEAFGDVEEVRTDPSGITAPMITNPQRGKLRALLGDSPEAKVSEILKRDVTILGQITKAEASKVITQLEADKL